MSKSYKWFELEESERVKKVFSKFTIEQFWKWWTDGKKVFMEVRIMDFNLIKTIANKINLPYSASGVYVKNEKELKRVIGLARNKAKLWFAFNPRKKNLNKYGHKSFGGGDNFVEQISFVFVDIDRIEKEDKSADNEDLENADIIANKIITKMNKYKFAENYIKICSGNGTQLLFRLDEPITMPTQKFDMSTKEYIEDEQFEKYKVLITETIGEEIKRFINITKNKKEYGMEVDKSGFQIARVCALPFTKNFKYNSFTWRGIIELKNGKNEGISDYIIEKEAYVNVQKYVKTNYRSKVLSQEFKLKPSKIMESKLVRFLLDSVLPSGQRNNYLIFSLKCLLKDNLIDFKCEEVKQLQRAINSNYGGHCVFNKPDARFIFNPNIVNKYCINNLMPPLYELWPERNKLINYNISTGQKTNEGWEYKLNSSISIDNKYGDIKLNESNNEMEDMIEIKKQMVMNGDKIFDKDSGLYMEIPWHNTDLFHKFLNGFRKKYGIKELRYYYEYVFPKFFCI